MFRSQRGALEAASRRKKFRGSALVSTIVFAGVLGSGSLRPTTVAAQTAQADDPVFLRELVGRIAGDGSGGKATLLVGTLQTVTPALALPPGWRIVGAVVREALNGPPGSGSTKLEFVAAMSTRLQAQRQRRSVHLRNRSPRQGGRFKTTSAAPKADSWSRTLRNRPTPSFVQPRPISRSTHSKREPGQSRFR